MSEIEKEFFDDIFPLYEPLFNAYKTKKPNWEIDNVFVPRVGKKYAKREGILFVGRAPNGTSHQLRELSDGGKFCPNGVKDYQLTHSLVDIYFNPSSVFWDVIRKVSYCYFSEEYWKKHPDEFWYDYIAYSNLYLIQHPDGKNPEGDERSIQFQFCDEILNQEIKLLSPKYVIFLTGWDLLKDFSIAKTMPTDAGQITIEPWDGYVAQKWIVDMNGFPLTYILSEHPQGKGQETHVRALLNLMQG